MISAFTNIFKIPELRERIFFTFAMIVIVRIGAASLASSVTEGVAFGAPRNHCAIT